MTDDEKRELIAEARMFRPGGNSSYLEVRLADALEGTLTEPDDEPCKAETHSWSHYRPEQIDSYWIRCTLLGAHTEHEDSNTGLTWGGV